MGPLAGASPRLISLSPIALPPRRRLASRARLAESVGHGWPQCNSLRFLFLQGTGVDVDLDVVVGFDGDGDLDWDGAP